MISQSQNIVTPLLPALDVLRAEIDQIDDQILSLLEQRYAVVKRVAWAKAAEAEQGLALRPGRERLIVDRLSAKAVRVPTADVAQIWRSILSLSAHHQRPYRLILCGPASAKVALSRLAASRYPDGIRVDWAECRQEAFDSALQGDAVVIVPADEDPRLDCSGLDLIAQHPTGCIEHPWALELGKLSSEEAPGKSWSPASWQRKVHRQLPAYPDLRLSQVIEEDLAGGEPVVAEEDVHELGTLLAEAQRGQRLLIQAGDCAEPLAATQEETLAMAGLVDALALMMERRTGLSAIRVGRLGGQFAKPRSRATEEHGSLRLPAYRGDGVNGSGACVADRTPDPRRLTLAHAQSQRVSGWLASARYRGGQSPIYTSHEALLLNYEAALTRRTAEGQWLARSAHSLWLGDRTCDLDGAHVEYLRGIGNPIGIKCGPSMTPLRLRQLLDRLNPERTPGRITLIARFGNQRVADCLAPLFELVEDEGQPVLWLCDPMHGNNLSVEGMKTRLVSYLIAETQAFVRVARSFNVHPGGLHLEVTPRPVLECVDDIDEATPDRPYETLCDPRLNPEQAMRVAAAYADAMEQRA